MKSNLPPLLAPMLFPLFAPMVLLMGSASGATPIEGKALIEPGTVVLRACPVPVHLEISRTCTSETRWSFPVRPQSGQAPGIQQRADTITATITAINVGGGTVTFTGPRGDSKVVKAHNSADLLRIRVGDLVYIAQSEARALAMRPVE